MCQDTTPCMAMAKTALGLAGRASPLSSERLLQVWPVQPPRERQLEAPHWAADQQLTGKGGRGEKERERRKERKKARQEGNSAGMARGEENYYGKHGKGA